jgi:hypothetical protein
MPLYDSLPISPPGATFSPIGETANEGVTFSPKDPPTFQVSGHSLQKHYYSFTPAQDPVALTQKVKPTSNLPLALAPGTNPLNLRFATSSRWPVSVSMYDRRQISGNPLYTSYFF